MRPSSIEAVQGAIADAARQGRRLEIRGGGSKLGAGAPREAGSLDMSGFTGVVDYDPSELILTVRAGTRLIEIEALLADHGQMLAFEPFDHGPLFGQPAGAATIGGIVAGGVSGSRRVTAGAVRDHVLGFEAVSGAGERFVAGGKVVKNVTGYDLPKLMAGSWGRLAVITEVTLKVLPRPRTQTTLVYAGLSPSQALRMIALAMGSRAEVGSAAHVPASLAAGRSLTALRLEGFETSVTARVETLKSLLSEPNSFAAIQGDESDALWQSIRQAAPIGTVLPLWRVLIPSSSAGAVIEAVEPVGARWLIDWAGSLIWVAFDGLPDLIREAAARAGGHATLIRGSATLRGAVPMFQPLPPAGSRLAERVRRAFDPAGVFETGRFLDERHADELL